MDVYERAIPLPVAVHSEQAKATYKKWCATGRTAEGAEPPAARHQGRLGVAVGAGSVHRRYALRPEPDWFLLR